MDRNQLEREEVFEKGQVLTNVPTHLNGIMELATIRGNRPTREALVGWSIPPHDVIIVRL